MQTITFDDTLYQLVPKEPTQRMFIAYAKAFKGNFHPDHPRMAWSAMLSAAPTPPAQPAERMPLTEERIYSVMNEQPGKLTIEWFVAFARAIESAHGIKP